MQYLVFAMSKFNMKTDALRMRDDRMTGAMFVGGGPHPWRKRLRSFQRLLQVSSAEHLTESTSPQWEGLESGKLHQFLEL